jgi:enterochelin esterase-like enzyme
MNQVFSLGKLLMAGLRAGSNMLPAVLLLLSAALALPTAVGALTPPERMSPSRVEDQTFWSETLGREMPYVVYLPPGYESDPQRRFPVLYMLHGLGGDCREWRRYGLFTAATRLIEEGSIPPLIIVTPEGGRSYWADHTGSGQRFRTYVQRDLVSMIDRQYRTLAARESRAIGGVSMGGNGALQIAIHAPETFRVVGAHSVALRRWEQAAEFFKDAADFVNNDPVTLYEQNAASARSFHIWIDIGAEDRWFPAARAFHEQLQADNVPHQWTVYEGGHAASYWQSHVADYLRFYGDALVSSPPAPRVRS